MLRSHVMLVSLAVALGASSSCQPRDADLVEIIEKNERRTGKLNKKGNKHGPWLQIHLKGLYQEVVTYRDGVEHGPQRTIGSDGTLMMDAYYRRGKSHGRERGFYDDGQLMELGWYRGGKKAGVWCTWDRLGRVDRMEIYPDKGSRRAEETYDYPGVRCPLTEGSGAAHRDPNNTDWHHIVPPRSRGTFHRRLPLP